MIKLINNYHPIQGSVWNELFEIWLIDIKVFAVLSSLWVLSVLKTQTIFNLFALWSTILYINYSFVVYWIFFTY